MRDNLEKTLEDLVSLFERYNRMGRSAWQMFQLGQEEDHVNKLKMNLLVHTQQIDMFTGWLTMASFGRMEPMMEKIYVMLRDYVRRDRIRAQTLRSEAAGSEESWDLLKMTLANENIPVSYVQEREDQIHSLIEGIILEESLDSKDPDSDGLGS
jgi:hypothetical protein